MDKLVQANGYMPWEQNPGCFKINKRAPHGDIILYPDLETAKRTDRDARKITDLNGTWKFAFFENPAACDAAFPEGMEMRMDTASWGHIRVPANWQMEGYDYPQYVNVKYPWEMTEDIMPPEIPRKYNPVGIYCRTFAWEKKGTEKLILHFDGIESCGEIYVNGKFAGYTESSFTQAEFDITGLVTEGENQLVVKVLRWCDGSWLEDQDFFRLAGIFRDVYLYSLPEVHISDYRVDALLDEGYQDGVFRVEADVAGDAEGCSVRIALYGEGKEVLSSGPLPVKEGKVIYEAGVESPGQWSAESPTLYTAVMTLVQGEKESILACRCGFRTFELKDGIMLINGKRIIFKGTNRHEFGARFGRAITREAMVADVISMKRNNINAVRTSHYPNHPYWYDLCDEYGLYVVDENNLETHGTWGYGESEADQPLALPGSNPDWTAAVVDRVSDMYYRDRNHPSILIWSLGNESYCGENFRAMAKFLRDHDGTRLVHYEGECHCPGYEDVSDMVSTMYTPVEKWTAYTEEEAKKPAVLCEFAHAMGNSCGSLVKYTEAFEKYPRLQGGFIWDYVDQAILTKDENGKEYLGYGGDFNEGYHDGNFSGNGLMFADRTETPKIKEVRICYQNIAFADVDWQTGEITLRNRSLFTDLGEYRFAWNLYVDEKRRLSGEFEIACAPGEDVKVRLPLPRGTAEGGLQQGSEAFLNVEAVLKEDTPWAKAGYAVAKGQFVTGSRSDAPSWAKAEGELRVMDTFGAWIITGSDFEYRFSKRSGDLYSIRRNGMEYLKKPVDCNFWRASTDNDRGCGQTWRSMVWRYAGQQAHKWVLKPQKKDGCVIVPMRFFLPVAEQVAMDIKLTIHGDGTMVFQIIWPGAGNLPDIPEIGLMFTLPEGFDRFEWHGRGEHESYTDRKESAFVGTWQSRVADRMVPYLMPQECGNMLDVRRLTLTNRTGGSLTFTGLPTVEANVLPYTPEEMETALHHKDLKPSDKTVVRINYRQAGVGGDDSWSSNANTHEEFRIKAENPCSFTFAVKPE